MKVLFLTFYFTPDLCAGSFRAGALVEELKKSENIELDVLTTAPNRYSQFNQKAPCFEQLNARTRVHRIQIPAHKSGIVDQIISFYYYYRAAVAFSKNKEFDLVVGTSSRLFTAFLAAKISKKLKVKLYLDIRDLFSKSISEILRRKRVSYLRFFINWIERYTFKDADRINLVSEGFVSYVHSKYPDVPISTYTNGIDEIFLNYDFVNNINKNDRKIILYAGNIGDGQGLHHILPGLGKKLENDAEIIVIGGGGRRHDLINEIQKQKCKNISVIPPLSRPELLQYYQKCDVLMLHLNDMEAFEEVIPSKIFEYAATGKPILAGVKGFAESFISNNVNNCKVFDPCDVDSCFNAYRTLGMKTVDRTDFKKKFSRVKIMSEMARDILNQQSEIVG